MSEQSWRVQTDALDYFGQRDKQLRVADRRPVIRRASDLVGPGIGASATRVTDFNDLLATYNGFYSSAPGAFNAPVSTGAFVFMVVSDADLGGMQLATRLTTNVQYRRVFTRSPSDPSSLTWTSWV